MAQTRLPRPFFKSALVAGLLCLFAPVQNQAQSSTLAGSTSSTATASTGGQVWWKHAVFYEVYPRSFQDSNGDGIGDLNGISQRLGYLQNLGVDAIWIAPMYPSPQVDFGYDISNYETVDPQYGTLADFDKLESAANQHGIRIILDMVLNHTSDKHAWFIESASSRTSPKADWYVWNDGIPADGPNVNDYQRKYTHTGPKGKVVPPNNWVSLFGGSAWEWVEARQQFYYHDFYKAQPDLNWRNPAVEKAMFDSMRFWLDRGVAGFRLDAIPALFEDPQLRNEPETGGLNAQGDPNLKKIYTDNLPEVHDTVRRMRKMIDSYPNNRVLIGETYLPNTAALSEWYGGAAANELQLPMDMLVGFGEGVAYKAPYFRQYLNEAQTQLNNAQPLIVFDNHDNIRSLDRFGDGQHNDLIARGIATMLLTSKATAMTYYGALLGMPTTPPTRKEDVQDPIGITGWPKEKGRDGERTPMQWTPGPQAGFSTNPKTWLPIPPSHTSINVQTELADPHSLLNWHKALIAARRDNPTLRDGKQTMINTDSTAVLSYVRAGVDGHSPILVAINLSGDPQTLTLDPSTAGVTGKSTHTLLTDTPSLDSTTNLNITLPPYATWIANVQ